MGLFLLVLGLAVLAAALILFIVGYTTHFWMSEETVLSAVDISVGLWKMVNCTDNQVNCYTISIPAAYTGGLQTGTIATASTVLGLTAIVLLMYLVYTFTETARTRCMKNSIIFVCIFIVIITVIMLILWIHQLPDHFYGSWSFGMACFGGILPMLAAFFLMLDDDPEKNESEASQPEKKNRVTPPPPSPPTERSKRPPPQHLSQRTPSVPPFTPHWHETQYTPSPKPEKRYYSPSVGRRVQPESSTRRQIFSPTSEKQSYMSAVERRTISPSQIRVAASSSMSTSSGYSSGSSRRYGTPKYAIRYDNHHR